MSYEVIIERGEIYLKRWNTEKRIFEAFKKGKQAFSDILQFHVTRVAETTFGQFFELVAPDVELFDRVFRGSTLGVPLGPYVEEIRMDAPKEPNEIQRVEVSWGAEVNDGEVLIYPDFHGWGKWPPYEDAPAEGGIAIEFTPLNEYKNAPLVLDTQFELVTFEPGKKPIPLGTRDFTVYDVLDAIFGEITWSGDITMGRKGGKE